MSIDQHQPAVYVAEDNPILLQGLYRALTVNGYRVYTAPDGAAMLRLLQREDPPADLLLLDVMMPEMSGIQLLERLRSEDRWMHLPVVLLTAATDDAVAAAAAADQRVDLLIKPFRLNDLLAAVARYIGAEAAAPSNS